VNRYAERGQDHKNAARKGRPPKITVEISDQIIDITEGDRSISKLGGQYQPC